MSSDERPILYDWRSKFDLSSRPPSTGLEPFVARFWMIAWDLREPYEQRVLPFPSVNMTFRTDGSRIAGVISGYFTHTLYGKGRGIGVRFKPGGFRPFLGRAVSTITDRYLDVREVFPIDPGDVLGAENMADYLDEFLCRTATPPDPTVQTVSDIVDLVGLTPGITRVDDLAERVGTSVRALQRLFAEYVGVGPKWVIRRYRILEAAGRAGESTDWGVLAADLGYADQAHFTREFSSLVGMSPARYVVTRRRSRMEREARAARAAREADRGSPSSPLR